MQPIEQKCSFQRTAASLQVAISRAQYTAENARSFADRIDASFTGTAGVADELVKEWERIERDLIWLRDLCIFASENTSFAEKLRSVLAAAEISVPAGFFDVGPSKPTARRQREGGVPNSWRIPAFGAPLASTVGKASTRA